MPTAAQRIVDQLVLLGAGLAFGVPGESYLAVLDALVDTPALPTGGDPSPLRRRLKSS